MTTRAWVLLAVLLAALLAWTIPRPRTWRPVTLAALVLVLAWVFGAL